jgi:hypothetical protein
VDARSVLFADAGGAQGIQLIRSTAGAAAIQSAILAASNADWLQSWEGAVLVNGAPAPVSAQYLPLKPAALLYYQCADGTQVGLRIPSPRIAIFMADSQTVDPVNGLIASLNAAAIGSLVNDAGSLATSFTAGRLESLQRR